MTVIIIVVSAAVVGVAALAALAAVCWLRRPRGGLAGSLSQPLDGPIVVARTPPPPPPRSVEEVLSRPLEDWPAAHDMPDTIAADWGPGASSATRNYVAELLESGAFGEATLPRTGTLRVLRSKEAALMEPITGEQMRVHLAKADSPGDYSLRPSGSLGSFLSAALGDRKDTAAGTTEDDSDSSSTCGETRAFRISSRVGSPLEFLAKDKSPVSKSPQTPPGGEFDFKRDAGSREQAEQQLKMLQWLKSEGVQGLEEAESATRTALTPKSAAGLLAAEPSRDADPAAMLAWEKNLHALRHRRSVLLQLNSQGVPGLEPALKDASMAIAKQQSQRPPQAQSPPLVPSPPRPPSPRTEERRDYNAKPELGLQVKMVPPGGRPDEPKWGRVSGVTEQAVTVLFSDPREGERRVRRDYWRRVAKEFVEPPKPPFAVGSAGVPTLELSPVVCVSHAEPPTSSPTERQFSSSLPLPLTRPRQASMLSASPPATQGSLSRSSTLAGSNWRESSPHRIQPPVRRQRAPTHLREADEMILKKVESALAHQVGEAASLPVERLDTAGTERTQPRGDDRQRTGSGLTPPRVASKRGWAVGDAMSWHAIEAHGLGSVSGRPGTPAGRSSGPSSGASTPPQVALVCVAGSGSPTASFGSCVSGDHPAIPNGRTVSRGSAVMASPPSGPFRAPPQPPQIPTRRAPVQPPSGGRGSRAAGRRKR
eukprot:TRINITY_DN8865_c0_g1_i1.p1 TRINITY_DN8865_c0_g1~~TRINITY_DN8865_c0_g1_i1.p1  ORF type:complete len:709 (+),score=207.87 TRINITY_DN8865_c0_g1_i1:81-2207(+)